MSAAMLGFLGLCLVMTLTPGLDTAMVVRNGVRRGPVAGVLTALGCALGLFVHAAAVAAGLAAILLRSAAVFEVVRWVGAAFLVLIGGLSLRAALTGHGVEATDLDDGRPSRTRGSSFVQGLLTNLTNPKATLFFLSALPQFVNPGSSVQPLPQAMLLAVIAATFSAVGLSLVGVLAGRARRWLTSVRAARVREGLMGAVLVGLGLKVALEHA
ncbi:MAG TPA: LysE family translocator [Propionibacteriaceae bacterium]|nr:LysE family translocator [Propionibacteriaceae bacterium]